MPWSRELSRLKESAYHSLAILNIPLHSPLDYPMTSMTILSIQFIHVNSALVTFLE